MEPLGHFGDLNLVDRDKKWISGNADLVSTDRTLIEALSSPNFDLRILSGKDSAKSGSTKNEGREEGLRGLSCRGNLRS